MMSSKKHLTPSKHKLQPSVILEVQGGGIAEVILNRPEALNALNEDLAQELVAALHECEHDSAIRCVVLRANGPAFMVGGDIRFFKEKIQEAYHQKETLQEAHRQKDLRQDIFQKLVQRIHPAIESIRRMPKPVVASVHGATAGFGVSLMAACDLAIAAHSSSFTLAYSNIGLSPDGGASYFLVRSLGWRKTMELCLLNERINSHTAQEIGLINQVLPDEQLAEATQQLANRLAQGPTVAYAQIKRLIDQSFDRNFIEQLAAEEAAFAHTASTKDFAEGIIAFLEKRPPNFQGT